MESNAIQPTLRQAKRAIHFLIAALITAIASMTSAIAAEENAVKFEGSLEIIAPVGALERGATDAKFDWLTGFEKTTGCKVRVITANTADEIVALMSEGASDLVIASGDASTRLMGSNRVRELDPSSLAGWDTIDPRLRDAPWHTMNDRHYGVPFQWRANILLYSTKIFKTPPRSWKVVFEPTSLPDGRTNVGRIQAFDGAIYLADAALYLKSARPELNIKDPYELNEEQYRVVLDLLRQQRRMIVRYWHDALGQVDDFASESVVASMSWPYQANLLKSKEAPVASAIPDEGVTGWADTTMMHVNASHPNCAKAWLAHSLNPKVQGDVAAWFGSVPAVPAACKNNALLGEQGCERNGANDFNKIYFWRAPTLKCASQNECVPYYRWVSDFTAILGGR